MWCSAYIMDMILFLHGAQELRCNISFRQCVRSVSPIAHDMKDDQCRFRWSTKQDITRRHSRAFKKTLSRSGRSAECWQCLHRQPLRAASWESWWPVARYRLGKPGRFAHRAPGQREHDRISPPTREKMHVEMSNWKGWNRTKEQLLTLQGFKSTTSPQRKAGEQRLNTLADLSSHIFKLHSALFQMHPDW
jgi:hypothetical protein